LKTHVLNEMPSAVELISLPSAFRFCSCLKSSLMRCVHLMFSWHMSNIPNLAPTAQMWIVTWYFETLLQTLMMFGITTQSKARSNFETDFERGRIKVKKCKYNYYIS